MEVEKGLVYLSTTISIQEQPQQLRICRVVLKEQHLFPLFQTSIKHSCTINLSCLIEVPPSALALRICTQIEVVASIARCRNYRKFQLCIFALSSKVSLIMAV